MAREISASDELKNRMLKLIPSEVIATYSIARGMIPESEGVRVRGIALLIVSVILSILTAPALQRLYGVRNGRQIALSMASFVVWVISIGDVVTQLVPGYKGWMGALLLAVWSFAVAVLASNYVVPAPDTPHGGSGS